MTDQKAIEEFNLLKKTRMFIPRNDTVDVAINAIEKQIPKVPCYSGDGYYNGEIVIDTWECPCCGKQYEIDYDDYEYCPNCGQHIDHSTLTEDD